MRWEGFTLSGCIISGSSVGPGQYIGDGRLEESVPKSQLLYEDSQKVPVLTGRLLQAAEISPRVRELEFKITGK